MDKNKQISIIAFLDEYCKIGNAHSERSQVMYFIRKYMTIRNYLVAFINHQYGKRDYPFANVDVFFVFNFKLFLKRHRDLNELKANQLKRYLDGFVEIAFREKVIENRIYYKYVNDVCFDTLSEDDLQIIISKKFSSTILEETRDIFIFSCFTGLSLSDLSILTTHSLTQDDAGNMYIETESAKSRRPLTIPLLSIPRRIVAKYLSGRSVDVKLFPISNSPRMNVRLEEIREICGIDKVFSFKTAINTFAKTIASHNGFSAGTVSLILGYAKHTTNHTYISNLCLSNEDKEKIRRDFMRIAEKIDNKYNSYYH